jgi:hypothetical protein
MNLLHWPLALTACSICAFYYNDAFIIIPLYVVICVYSLIRIGWAINLSSVLGILILYKFLEWALFGFIHPMGNYVIYPTWIAVDLLVYFSLIWRAPAMRSLIPSMREEFCITNADIVLGGIHLVYCAISLLALIEHCLRHLDDFGFSPDSELVIWFYENARLIYSAYPLLKTGLNGIELLAIFSTAGRYMQSARVLGA